MLNLFIRKYVLIILAVIIFYPVFLLAYLFNYDGNTIINNLNYSFILLLINSLLIRLSDDFMDYEKDLSNNRIVFHKKTLMVLIVILVIINSVLAFITSYFLGLLFIGYLLMLVLVGNNFFTKKDFSKLKICYLPSLILIMYHSIKIDVLLVNYIFIIISIVFSLVWEFKIRK